MAPMEFRRRVTVRNGYCFYFSESLARHLISEDCDDERFMNDIRAHLRAQFKREDGGVLPLPDRTDT